MISSRRKMSTKNSNAGPRSKFRGENKQQQFFFVIGPQQIQQILGPVQTRSKSETNMVNRTIAESKQVNPEFE